MFQNYLSGIKNIGTYPLISLLVFFVFFLGMAIWWIGASKKHLDEMSNLPFDGDNNIENNKPNN